MATPSQFSIVMPGDGDDTNHVVHLLAGAVRPRHTLIGSARRTARWTLRSLFAGAIDLPQFTTVTSTHGRPCSLLDSSYSDN